MWLALEAASVLASLGHRLGLCAGGRISGSIQGKPLCVLYAGFAPAGFAPAFIGELLRAWWLTRSPPPADHKGPHTKVRCRADTRHAHHRGTRLYTC